MSLFEISFTGGRCCYCKGYFKNNELVEVAYEPGGVCLHCNSLEGRRQRVNNRQAKDKQDLKNFREKYGIEV